MGACGGNGKPKHNKKKRMHKNSGSDTQDTVVNAGFNGPRARQKTRHFKGNKDGPSQPDKILDRPCQIDGTSDKPANHTKRE